MYTNIWQQIHVWEEGEAEAETERDREMEFWHVSPHHIPEPPGILTEEGYERLEMLECG